MQLLDFPESIIVTLPPEIEDDMAAPTNKERLEAIGGRLIPIEIALGLKPPIPHRGWGSRIYERVVNNRGTSLVLAVILCIATLGKYYLDHKDDGFNKAVDARIDCKLDGQVNQQKTRYDERVVTTKSGHRSIR